MFDIENQMLAILTLHDQVCALQILNKKVYKGDQLFRQNSILSWMCSKSVVMLTTYNSSQKVIVHVSESGQKNGLAASRGSISQSWHCSKIKTRAGAVLCSKVRTILWRQRRRGGGAFSAGSISYLAGKKGLFQIEFLFIYLSAEQLSWKTTWVMPAI